MVASSASLDTGALNLNDPKTYELVRQIYYKRFSRRVEAAGIDADDGFQEICLGLIRRQSFKSRYAPERGALSTYLFWFMGGVTMNMAAAAKRRLPAMSVGELAEEIPTIADTMSERNVEDLAAEMEVPAGVLVALTEGRDPFLAAMDAEMDVVDALQLMTALGVR